MIFDKCLDIKLDIIEMLEVIEKIVICFYSDKFVYKLGNKLIVSSMEYGVM